MVTPSLPTVSISLNSGFWCDYSLISLSTVSALFMLTISKIMYSLLKSVGMIGSVFLSSPPVAIKLSVFPNAALFLIAITLIETGSIIGLAKTLSDSKLLVPASYDNDLSIFSNNPIVGVILVCIVLQAAILGWLNPEIGILVSIASICIIICVGTVMLQRGLSHNDSVWTEFVDTHTISVAALD